jgi:hypothetical protein
LADRLAALRDLSGRLEPHPRLLSWGVNHLQLSGDELQRWAAQAWWGIAAGELAMHELHQEEQRPRFLALVDEPDWGVIDQARAQGGAILATAHLGPRKTAMHYCLTQPWPWMLWTHYNGPEPPLLASRKGLEVLDPMDAATSSFILGRTAFHLREGGLLFAAPDGSSGARTIVLERLGRPWSFSLGVPVLARRLKVPVFLLLALWRGSRIRLEIQPFEPPSPDLPEAEWLQAWIERYWTALEQVITSSPENLRFLRWMFSTEEVDALLAPAGFGAEGLPLTVR